MDELQRRVNQATNNWLVACRLYGKAQAHLYSRMRPKMAGIDQEALSNLLNLARDKEIAFWEMMQAFWARDCQAKATDERPGDMGGVPQST
jgi:hypothetical protein